MYEHHKESIINMVEHYRKNPEIQALFLVGSVATDTARADSDIDGVAIVSQDEHERRRAGTGLEEVLFGKCTYERGYFNVHYMTRENLIDYAKSGSEPIRNMFNRFQTLFSHDSDLPKLAEKIPVFPKDEAGKKKLKFYCTFKQFYSYFWVACKPQGFMRFHVADGMIFNLYRLILLENEILFPSMRKLEEYVISAPNKPDGIINLCHSLMKTLSDKDCKTLVEIYENWTNYDYPKDHNIVMNNFVNQWEWQ